MTRIVGPCRLCAGRARGTRTTGVEAARPELSSQLVASDSRRFRSTRGVFVDPEIGQANRIGLRYRLFFPFSQRRRGGWHPRRRFFLPLKRKMLGEIFQSSLVEKSWLSVAVSPRGGPLESDPPLSVGRCQAEEEGNLETNKDRLLCWHNFSLGKGGRADGCASRGIPAVGRVASLR